jgi:serine/threonine-protein kinase
MNRPRADAASSEPITELFGHVEPRSQATVDFQAGATSDPQARTEIDGIPGYRLVGRLGGGGMGDVFLASQLFSTADDALRTVAIKTIRAELLTSRRHRQIMENDIRIAALLGHPNIVRILEVGPADGPLYYTMPYLKGGSLADKIDGAPLSARDAAAILLQVALAVEYLHSQPTPIIHLDLKPGNILLDDDGTAYVADFGLSRLMRAADGESVTRLAGGTPEYMAPEQFDGWVSPSCDIYGLGAILYKMLTGRPPFIPADLDEARRQAREHELLPPRAWDAQIDRGLEAISLKCLDKDPAQRYPSAAAVADELRRFLAGETPQALHPCWFQSLRRHVSREIRFDAAASWAEAMLWQAVLTCPAYLSVYGLLWLGSPAWLYWIWLVGLLPLAEWGPWLVLQRGRRRDSREREILLLWGCVGVAKAILFGLNCPLVGLMRPEDVLEFFPASMAVNGLMLCLEGRLYWGRLYIVGLLDFLAAIIMACVLPLAPLLFALWNSVVLVLMGLHMRRRAPK